MPCLCVACLRVACLRVACLCVACLCVACLCVAPVDLSEVVHIASNCSQERECAPEMINETNILKQNSSGPVPTI